MKSVQSIIFAAVCLLSPYTSRAAVVYVFQSAPGALHDGYSWQTAFTTIQAGLDAAKPGDQLFVAGGGYQGPIYIRTNSISVLGGFDGAEAESWERAPSKRTTLTGSGFGVPTVAVYASDIVLDGFNITHGDPGITTSGSHVKISHNTITDNGTETSGGPFNTVGGGGIVIRAGGPVFVTENDIEDNRAAGGAGIFSIAAEVLIARNRIVSNVAGGFEVAGQGGGIYVSLGALTIIDNLIAHNAAIGFSTYAGSRALNALGGGVYLNPIASVFSNNTVAYNLVTGSGRSEGGGLFAAGSVVAANNIFHGNSAVPFISQGTAAGGGLRIAPPTNGFPTTAVAEHHNLFFGNAPDDGVATDANADRHADALFVATGASIEDFRLKPESPAIDIGDNGFALPGDSSLDGRPRVLGPIVDIGAYESPATPADPVLNRVYVRPDGDDRNSGASWPAAKGSIGAALSVAAIGAHLWVAAGTYYETLVLKDGIQLLGGFNGTEPYEGRRDPLHYRPVLDGERHGPVVTIPAGTKDVTVDGFTITHGGSPIAFGQSSGGITTSGEGVTISQCIIEENTATSVAGSPEGWGGGIDASGGSVTIANNVVRRNTQVLISTDSPPNFSTTYVASGAGIGVGLCSAIVANNLIADNGSRFIGHPARVIGDGEGLAVENVSGQVLNNTIVGNMALPATYGAGQQYLSGGALAVFAGPDGLLVANNIVAFNGAGLAGSSDRVTLKNNDVYGNGPSPESGYPAGSDGNIAQDPLFGSRVTCDYHLQPLSPCIDTGLDSTFFNMTDLDGRPRVAGVHIDMGAYETPPYGIFTLGDAASALRIAAGLNTPSGTLVSRLNVVEPGVRRIDLADAIRLIRKVSGLDPNP